MSEKKKQKLPIINAHAHVFTKSHVPPLLAKKFMPFPLYYLAHLDVIIWLYTTIKKINNLYYQNWHRSLRSFLYKVSIFITRNPILRVIRWLLGVWLVALSFYYLYDWLVHLFNEEPSRDIFIVDALEHIREFLKKYHVFPINLFYLWKTFIVLFVLFFIKSGRNFIFYIFKKIFKFFKLIPGKETQKLIERYLLIAKFAVYKKQTNIFSKMKDQYPKGSGFVLLPMDMKYMKAGKCKDSYQSQLKDLANIKNSRAYKEQHVKIYPFIFIDPRRIRNDQKKVGPDSTSKLDLFNYDNIDGQITLKESLVKTYIEDYEFSGFKIYPAIGYYPFEKELLPLWKYAADNEIPIMSHCIKGTIFYRGNKATEWDEHWVFKDEKSDKQLLLPEIKNIEFQRNFTHPMNFLCLLEEPFLRVLIGKYNDDNLNTIFGFVDSNTPLKRDLRNLKICLAHYGGGDQWKKYLEKDSYGYSQQIIKRPGFGIDFIKSSTKTGGIDYDRLAQMWKYVDWYSIISSMMMQYPNVYADISYILHDAEIFPLLKETLKSRYLKLNERVLFGTDFYVVRNHNSEKDLFITSDAQLNESEFNLIARINPNNYLKSKN